MGQRLVHSNATGAASASRTAVNGRPPADDAALGVGLIGASEAHRSLLCRLQRVAPTNAEILILGPSGVGKELYARYIHKCSERCDCPFVPVNCGAFPDGLFENEMFGHGRGAFTGAQGLSDGLVAAAQGGTLFLDEVGELSPSAQVKLLRLLQEKEYRRLGEARLRRANVRFISATNTRLEEATQEKRFREDLFFRLRVVPVEVPPLRDRPADVGALLSTFIHRYAEAYALPAIELSPGAIARLASYHWPGNVRELENCVHSLTCQQLERPIEARDLPLLEDVPCANNSGCLGADLLARPFQQAKREMVDQFEREYIEGALRRAGGNIAEAARLAGKHRRAFFELMRKHEIGAERFRDRSPSPA